MYVIGFCDDIIHYLAGVGFEFFICIFGIH